MRATWRAWGLALMSGGLMAFSLASAGGGAVAASGTVHEVAIRGFTYVPAHVTIRAGDVVRWTNEDAAPHDAVELGQQWQTPLLKTGESGEVRFDRPGLQSYYCTVHPAMRGTVEVR